MTDHFEDLLKPIKTKYDKDLIPALEKNNIVHVYGPVPSRRLGFSLGVDILPFKTCSLNCIYCQLGPSLKTTSERNKYFDPEIILTQIKKANSSNQQIDYVTFSGSGEPTLNASIGELILDIKRTVKIPVAVLTNSTLMFRKSVREALIPADLLVPSLDAATQQVFERVNKPDSSLKVEDIIEGLIKFRQEFEGTIWLEILFVKGVNDSKSHLKKLKEAITRIKPDRIHLNTVVRPPAEHSALPLNREELEKIKGIFGENCEIVVEFANKTQNPLSENLDQRILSMVKRRPMTLHDISTTLGTHQNEILKYMDSLLKKNKIKGIVHKGQKYYEPF